MKKFGEISRFEIDEYKYLFYAHRYTYKQEDIPWIDFCLTRKNAKKLRAKKYKKDRVESRYELIGGIPISGMRKLLKQFKEYFSNVNSDFVAISGADDFTLKRLEFYEKQMNRLGWIVCDTLMEEWYYNYSYEKYNKKVLIFRRK